MTTSFRASAKAWADKARRNAPLVLREATQSVVSEMTERQPSAAERGGPPQAGKVPVDTGVLINSLGADLGGTGAGDFDLAISGFEFGDVLTAGFLADYAVHVEYGTANMQGAFFVRNAALGWSDAVDAAAKKVGG